LLPPPSPSPSRSRSTSRWPCSESVLLHRIVCCIFLHTFRFLLFVCSHRSREARAPTRALSGCSALLASCGSSSLAATQTRCGSVPLTFISSFHLLICSAVQNVARALRSGVYALALLFSFLIITLVFFSSAAYFLERGEWSEDAGAWVLEDGTPRSLVACTAVTCACKPPYQTCFAAGHLSCGVRGVQRLGGAANSRASLQRFGGASSPSRPLATVCRPRAWHLALPALVAFRFLSLCFLVFTTSPSIVRVARCSPHIARDAAGDVVPKTFGGKLVGSMAMITGVLVISMPSGPSLPLFPGPIWCGKDQRRLAACSCCRKAGATVKNDSPLVSL